MHGRLITTSLIIMLAFGSKAAFSQAPTRSGQPYAEAQACAKAGVILCEDFNYPQNFTCGPFSYNPGQFQWLNPGLSSTPTDGMYCQGSTYDLASGYLSQPTGSPAGGYVKRVNPASGNGTLSGCIWGDCDRNTANTGSTYKNGLPITNDLYFRFQIYFSANYVFPTDLDNKLLFLYPDRYTSKTDGNFDAGLFFSNATYCFNVNRVFSDAPDFRVGTNSNSYKQYPADANAGPGHNEHQEYCSGQGFGNNNGTVITTTPPNDTPTPGRLFRVNKDRWYTFEMRYKMSGSGQKNGTIEFWVNGIKVYSDSDLETCGNYGSNQGSCSSVAEIFFSNWFNPFGSDSPAGYTLVDNLMISKSYIGPPGGSVDNQPPNPPTALTLAQSANLLLDENQKLVADIKIQRKENHQYYLFKDGVYYSKIVGDSFRDPWVKPGIAQKYQIWEYKDGKALGCQRLTLRKTRALG